MNQPMATKSLKCLTILNQEQIIKLERFTEEICAYYYVDDEYFGNIMLSTVETARMLFMMNEKYPSKKMNIEYEKEKNGIKIRFTLKEGSKKANNETDHLDQELRKHNIEKNLYIVKTLADKVNISKNLKHVELNFYISSINHEKSLSRIEKLKDYWSKTKVGINKGNE